MTNIPYHFNRNDLPLNNKMKLFWDDNGFLIIDNFYLENECDELINRAKYLVQNFDSNSNRSVFNTNKQKKVKDDYFLNSGDKIRFFFEEGAFDNNGNLTNSIELLINKIGHALHDLDHIFENFSRREDLNQIANSIGIEEPKLLQSMYIFKQPKIGGEVICHQDSTFLNTSPESTVGFWVALEDANIENGCMWASRGGHKGPLRKIFKRKKNELFLEVIDQKPFEKLDTPLEVKKGTLILLHGRLPHYSCENKSKKSRHAYTLHIIDGKSKYSEFNWLQRNKYLPLRGFK
tara:strand:+ start:357 stop:1229 length:873 start_codon:yes stop_codon:yes gene_type:complete